MSQGPYFKELSIVLRQAGFTVLPEQDEFLPVEWEPKFFSVTPFADCIS